MKKIIKLTETDLHKIIKESVKRILKENQENELDWKTYANAAEKQFMRNENPKRQQNFVNAAQQAFDKKYPNQKETEDPNTIGRFNAKFSIPNFMDYRDNHKHHVKADMDYFDDNDSTSHHNQFSLFHNHDVPYTFGTTYNSNQKPEYGLRQYIKHDIPTKFQTDYENAENDLLNYYCDKSNYIKGKGWK